MDSTLSRDTPSRGQQTTDAVLAGLFGLACLPLALLGDLFDIAALVGFSSALAVRRRSPGWSLGIAWAAALLQMLALRDLQPYDLAVLGVLYSTAVHGSRLVSRLGLVSAGVGAIVAAAYLGFVKPLLADAVAPLGGDPPAGVLMTTLLLVASAAVLGLAWTAGRLVRSVRDARQTRRREELATRERELAEYRVAVEQERNRIARDMHDVVAHSLAVVIAQADGARFAASTRPEAPAEALGTIAGVAREALGDVRLLLAELRHSEGESPQPVLDDLGELVDRMRRSGLDVRFVESGEPVPLGAGHQIAVFRIVQEALTNALRHGDADAPVELVLAWHPTGVGVDVVNATRPGAVPVESHLRHGITGMRERASSTGGSLEAGVRDGAFRVSADIPAPDRRSA